MCVKPASHWLALAILLVMGASVRLYSLGAESLWLDEVFSLRLSELSFDEFWDAIQRDTHPPLFPLLLHFWITIFGTSEFALRLPSVLCSILAIGLLWDIARKARISAWARNAGVGAACLSPLLIAHSQEARPHVLLMVLGIASLSLFLKLCHRFSWAGALSLVGVNAAILYTQYLGTCLILAEVLTLFVSWLRSWQVEGGRFAWIGIFVGSGVLFLPWLPSFADQLAASQEQMAWLEDRGWLGILGDFRLYTGPARSGFGWLGLALLLGLTLIGVSRGTGPGFTRTAMVLWVCVGIGIPLLLSFGLRRPIPIARATLATSLVIFLLAGAGLERLGRSRLISTGLLSILLIWGTVQYYVQSQKRPWRQAATFIQSESRGPEPAIFCAPVGRVPYRYYEPGSTRPLERLDWGLSERQLLDGLRRATRGRSRFWLVLSYLENHDAIRVRDAAFALGYRIRTEHPLWKLTLIHYERDSGE